MQGHWPSLIGGRIAFYCQLYDLGIDRRTRHLHFRGIFPYRYAKRVARSSPVMLGGAVLRLVIGPLVDHRMGQKRSDSMVLVL